jgi:hypothetical protein
MVVDKVELKRKVKEILYKKELSSSNLRSAATILGKFTRSDHSPAESRQHGLVGLFAEISSSLDHFKSSRSLKSLFETTYSFAKENPEFSKDLDSDSKTNEYAHVKNFDENKADEFIELLCNAAHKARVSKHESIEVKSREIKFIANGKRGVGKTFFMNYLTSAKGHHFDQKCVIYVRVNLTRVYEDWQMLDRLAHQVVYILRDKYFRNTTNKAYNTFTIENFKSYLAQKCYENKSIDDILWQIKNLKPLSDIGLKNQTTFIGAEELENYNVNKIHLETFEALLDYIQSEGWGLNFVIDGLDAIEMADNHEADFESWVQETISIVASAKYNVSWLLFLRPDSYIYYKTKFEGKGQRSEKHTYVEIHPSCPYQVIEKRLKKLSKTEGYPVEFVAYYYVALIEFIGHSLRINPQTVLYDLLSIFAGNMRRLLRNVHLASIEFLEVIESTTGENISFKDTSWHRDFNVNHATINVQNDESWTNLISKNYQHLNSPMKRFSYKIVECLVNGEAIYHTESLKFSLVNGKIRKQIEGQELSSTGVMPNIFGFPRKLYSQLVCDDKYYFTRWFYKLVFLISVEDTYSSESNVPLPHSIYDLKPRLAKYGITEHLFNYLLMYFKTYGLIELKTDVDDDEIFITKAGLLVRETLIESPDYARCILNSTQLPRELLKESAGFIQIFDGKFTDIESNERKVSKKRVRTRAIKLANRLVFCRFLNFCWEEAKKEMNLSKDPIVSSIDSVLKQLTENHLNIAERLINSAINDKQFVFVAAIEESLNYVTESS